MISHLNHQWIVVRDTGWVIYEECAVCKRRHITERNPKRERADFRWLTTGVFQPETPAHVEMEQGAGLCDPIDAYRPERVAR